MPDPNPIRGSDWSADEVQRAVSTYFEMLKGELKGQRYSKTEFRLEPRSYLAVI